MSRQMLGSLYDRLIIAEVICNAKELSIFNHKLWCSLYSAAIYITDVLYKWFILPRFLSLLCFNHLVSIKDG